MKLVRSKVAARISKEDSKKISSVYNEEEFMTFLRLKLSEEISELKETNFKDVYEYADVLEVLETIMSLRGVTMNQVFAAKSEKADKEGNLKDGLLYTDRK